MDVRSVPPAAAVGSPARALGCSLGLPPRALGRVFGLPARVLGGALGVPGHALGGGAAQARLQVGCADGGHAGDLFVELRHLDVEIPLDLLHLRPDLAVDRVEVEAEVVIALEALWPAAPNAP